MYKWLVISLTVLSASIPIFFQNDFWPFSSYSMFNSNLSNSILHEQRIFELVGVNAENKRIPISSQLVTGAVHPGMVSAFLNKLFSQSKDVCANVALEYWGKRYQENRMYLPSYLRNIAKLAIIEKESKRGSMGFYAEYLIK